MLGPLMDIIIIAGAAWCDTPDSRQRSSSVLRAGAKDRDWWLCFMGERLHQDFVLKWTNDIPIY